MGANGQHGSHMGALKPGVRGRRAVSLVFGLFLSLSLAVVAALAVVRMGALTPQALRAALTDAYCDEVETMVGDHLESYAQEAGLIDASLAAEAFGPDDVRHDVTAHADAVLAGEAYACPPEEERLTWEARVAEALTEAGEVPAEHVDEVAAAYAADVADLYQQAVEDPAVAALGEAQGRLRSRIDSALAASVAAALIIAAALIKMRGSVADHLVGFIGATGGASLLMLVSTAAFRWASTQLATVATAPPSQLFCRQLVLRLAWLCTGAAGIYAGIVLVLAAVLVRVLQRNA